MIEWLPPSVPAGEIRYLRVGREVAMRMLADGFVSPCPVHCDPTYAPDEIRAGVTANLITKAPSYVGRVTL